MPHDFGHAHSHHHHGEGHNGGGEHFHSHVHEPDQSEDIAALSAEFVSSFRTATDKAAFLALAGVPRQIDSETGGPSLKLVDARETTEWQVASASPSFGTQELSYLPYPGDLIKERQRFELTYVSMRERRDVPIEQIIAERLKNASDEE